MLDSRPKIDAKGDIAYPTVIQGDVHGNLTIVQGQTAPEPRLDWIVADNDTRDFEARDINNSTIIQGDINPEKSWGTILMELTGWMATIGSFVVAVIALFKS